MELEEKINTLEALKINTHMNAEPSAATDEIISISSSDSDFMELDNAVEGYPLLCSQCSIRIACTDNFNYHIHHCHILSMDNLVTPDACKIEKQS